MLAALGRIFRYRTGAKDEDDDRRQGPRPERVAYGIGGNIRLFSDRIEIHRSGLLLNILDMLLHVEREIETTIFLEDLAAAHIVRSLLLVEYVRFSYPGSPQPTGRYFRDAFAENALMLRWTDNRDLRSLIHRMNELRALRDAPRPLAAATASTSLRPEL